MKLVSSDAIPDASFFAAYFEGSATACVAVAASHIAFVSAKRKHLLVLKGFKRAAGW